MDELIELSSFMPFGKGGNRLCFVDPRDESRCIKVVLPHKTPNLKRANAPGLKRFRCLSYYDDNLRELETYHRIEASLTDKVWSNLPRCYGMVNTDLGAGIVTDVVRDYTGEISQSLRAKMRNEGSTLMIREAVERFSAYLRETLLPTRDILLHNLVAEVLDDRGRCELHVIDGFGSADMIPYAYWLKGLARKKVERKLVKLNLKVATLIAEESLPCHHK
jgi:hypothetical protein